MNIVAKNLKQLSLSETGLHSVTTTNDSLNLEKFDSSLKHSRKHTGSVETVPQVLPVENLQETSKTELFSTKRRCILIEPDLVEFYSFDVEDLKTYSPVDQHHFGFNIDLTFSPKGEHNRDYFKAFLCTSSYLEQLLNNKIDIFNGRGYHVFKKYDFKEIKAYICAIMETCSARTEEEVMFKLCRIGKWEFENTLSDTENSDSDNSELTNYFPKLTECTSSITEDLDSYTPEDPKNFCIDLHLKFKLENELYEHEFQVSVCTSSYLKKKIDTTEGVFNCRHHLVVQEFDIQKLKIYIENFAKNCSGKTMEAVMYQLTRLAKWEFET